MPACVGNPLAGDPIWEASSASELRIAITTKQVSRAGHPRDLLVASPGYGVGRAGKRRPDPPAVRYRLITRPALAEMVGDGRPWTVLMISLLSIPWR
jgi:hypothetical protein